MIIRRYLVKETLKTQSAILFILFVIFFSQKLIRILSSAINGSIPHDLIMPILILGISNMAELILPLSLFLGILITLGRFYSESEMAAMQACGIKPNVIYQAVLLLSLFTCSISAVNSIWFGAWSNVQEELLRENAKLNPSLSGLIAGKFQQTPDGKSVIYIGNINQSTLNHVFIAQLKPKQGQRPAITIADKGRLGHDKQGNQIVTLAYANRYEGSVFLNNFRIMNFENYSSIIKKKSLESGVEDSKKGVSQLTLFELRKLHTTKARAEYYWRLTLIISVPLMAFLVIPLSVSNPRQGRFAQILPALLVYLIYFLINSSIKSNSIRGRLDPGFWFYVINLTYFMIAVVLNCWNSTMMRKLRQPRFAA